MSAYLTAMTGAGTCVAVGVVAIARIWPGPRGRHRATGRTVSLEELLGSPSAYTTPSFTDVPEFAVIAQCFDDCPNCEQTTAGVLHKDGWTCGQCLTPVVAGGAS